MHANIYVMTDKENAKTSAEARAFAFGYLQQQGFAGEGTRFSCPIADWFVVGGRWSGEFTKQTLDKDKIQAFEKEFEKKYGYWINKSVSQDDRRKQSEKLFKEYFPDFDGKMPYWRNGYNEMGADDDAVIVNNAIYTKIVKAGMKNGIEDGGAVVDTNGWDVCNMKKKDIVGKKWIVVVDFHS